MESSDEYPFLYACSLMDETVNILDQYHSVKREIKNLEEIYHDQEDTLPDYKLEEIVNLHTELVECCDPLLEQYEKNLARLNDVVTNAIRKEFDIKFPTGIPEIFVKEMSESATVSGVIQSWMSYGIEKYISEKGFLKPLLRKRSQLIYLDDYGEERTEKWEQELNEFSKRRDFGEINTLLLSIPERFKTILDKWTLIESSKCQCFGDEAICEDNFYWFAFKKDLEGNTTPAFDHVKKLSHLLEKCLSLYPDNGIEKNNEQVEPTAAISPYEFEEKIGRKFKILGWDTQVTKGSGDQGADVVITKGDLRGVVQCKLYSQPVGNKAVQEVHAAKGFYDANLLWS